MQNIIINIILVAVIINILFYLFKIIANKYKLIDRPQNLSVHQHDIPTGAGIIFVIVLIVFYFLFKLDLILQIKNINFPNREYILFFSVFALGVISFYDDIKEVHPIYRLGLHFIIVLISLPLLSFYIPSEIQKFLPLKLLTITIIFFWVYIINIYNFLDGSNGYLTCNSLQFFIGFCLTNILNDNLDFNFYLALLLILLSINYLFYNFPIAKIFMGDSGSITIGYLIGYLFLVLLFNGDWAVGIALIIYPVMDVSLTIIRKMLNNKYPWERLFDYFFLRALMAVNKNHIKIFNISLLFNLLNVVNVYVMIYFDLNYLLIVSLLFASTKIYLFNNIIKINTN